MKPLYWLAFYWLACMALIVFASIWLPMVADDSLRWLNSLP